MITTAVEFAVNRWGWQWLLIDWWRYVLDDSRCHDKSRGDDEWLNGRLWQWVQNHDWHWSWWISRQLAYLFRCQCRARNHPYGVGWYNVAGLEPDMDCLGCGGGLRMSDYQRCCQCLAVVFSTHPAYPYLCDDCGWQEARLMERVRSAGDGALEFSVLCSRVMNGEQTPERKRWEVR